MSMFHIGAHKRNTEHRISYLQHSCDNQTLLYPGLMLLPFISSDEMQHKGENKYQKYSVNTVEKCK